MRVPIRFEARGGGDQPGAVGEHGGHGIRRQLARGGVEVDPAHRGAGRLGGVHPRADVRVVVEAGDDDLVAGPPVLGQRAGEVVGQGGGTAAEHDAARVGPEQVGQGGAAVGDHLLGPPLRRGDPAAVGDRAGQGVGDGPRHDVGGLAAARPVEVRGPLGERGEVGTDRGDVVRHTRILPQPAPRRRVQRGSPGGVQRASLGEAGGALQADGGPLVELLEGPGPGVRAAAAQAGDDLVEHVLDARAGRVDVHPSRADALLEHRLAGALVGRVARGPAAHRPRRRHAERLLELAARLVGVEVAGRLEGAGEPRADHHVRGAGGQGEGDVARMPHAPVGPHVTSQLARRRGALEHRGELGAADGGHHPGRAHRAGADPDLDDVGPGLDEVSGALRRHHVAGDDGHSRVERAHRPKHVEHLLLVSVRGVDDEHVGAGVVPDQEALRQRSLWVQFGSLVPTRGRP